MTGTSRREAVSQRQSATAAPGLRSEGSTLLSLESLAVGYGDRVVLHELSFGIPRRGVLGLLGPAGVGKSTLLRTLSRWNETLPAFWRTGRVRFEGHDLFADFSAEEIRRQVALLIQKSRLYTATVLDNVLAEVRFAQALRTREKRSKARAVLGPLGLWQEYEPYLDEPAISLSIGRQRRLSVARLAAGGPHALLLDEPFRDLPPEEQEKMIELLGRIGRELPVVVSTHHQALAKRVTDRVVLLAGCRLVEEASTVRFFQAPETELAQEFVRTGNCWPREPGPKAEDVLPQPRPIRARLPSELHWLIPDRLGGCQQPGLLQDLDQELAGLRRLGCEILISLRRQPPDEEAARRHGLESHHFPVPDMGAPSAPSALALCERLSEWVEQGKTTMLHCKAGLGRTGMLLAAFLVYRGASAVAAVEQVRSINARYIQSDTQMELLTELEKLLGPSG